MYRFMLGQLRAIAVLVVAVGSYWVAAGQTAGSTPPATPPAVTVCGATAASPAASPLMATPAGTPGVDTDAPAIGTEAGLLSALKSCGLTVTPAGSVTQPFLRPESASVLRVSGGPLREPADLQVYTYADADLAEADAAQILPDGNLRTVIIEWVAPPHFFQQGPLIVLYVGEDATMVALLTELLGPAFAGAT